MAKRHSSPGKTATSDVESSLPGDLDIISSGATAASPREGTPAIKSPRRILSGAPKPVKPRGRSRTPQPEPAFSASCLEDSRIGIIGAGAMGGALCRGLADSRVVPANRVMVSDPHTQHVQDLARSHGIVVATDNCQLASTVDIIVLAVKPYNVDLVIEEIASSLNHEGGSPLIICIAAGIATSRIENKLASIPEAPAAPVIRAMPNTPAQVGKGACAYCKGTHTTPAHLAQAGDIFRSVGIAVEVPETMMDAVTALSGSGPAYIYLMIEALVDGGVRAGLPRDIAAKLASQTVLGAAQMVIDTGMHPAQLRDMVTTPAGTTIEAIASLEHSGLRAALIDAIGKAAARSKELG